jgi:hypothetical protein
MENGVSYAVVWMDDDLPLPSAGKLVVIDGSVILTAKIHGRRYVRSFGTDEIEAMEIVRSREARLGDRPTLAVALADGSFVRISELNGFGIVGEIAHALST